MNHLKMARPAPNRSMAFLCFVVLIAVCDLAWLGCGVKSAPIPPEDARPEQILDLQAASAKNGVRLTWSRPEKYAGGDKITDLAGFTVSRSEADANYGQVFSFWDRLLGTRRTGRAGAVEFGVEGCHKATSQHLLSLLAQPMLRT